MLHYSNYIASVQNKVALLAAGSLSMVFRDVARNILSDKNIVLDTEFGSTARMAKLIHDGTPCDIFASADTETAQAFVDLKKAECVIPFVRNDIVAVSRKDFGITEDTLSGFLTQARPLSIGISDPQTQPCGAGAVKSLSNVLPQEGFHDKVRIVTGGMDKKKEKAAGEKSDYTLALEREADILLVFRTTAKKICAQADWAETIELPSPMKVTSQYGLVMLTDNPQSRDVVDFICSKESKGLFESYGFQCGPPLL